jgi:hypothetical protein
VRANLIAALIGVLCVAGCGGGGSSLNPSGGGTPTGSNVQVVTVDSGPSVVANSTSPAVNTLYTSVLVCTPGTSTCQTIDHIQVDTGSSGLRILASALTLSLPLQTTSSGAAIAECVQFVDGSSWGPLRLADIKIAGETASNQAVHIIGDPAYTIPTACTGTGKTENTVTAFGANGILGVGPFLQDCGSNCTVQGAGIYYTCTASATCTDSAMPLTQQITNPVAAFATDNNGIIIQLNAVSGTASSVSGTLTFGINTQSNNALGGATLIKVGGNGSVSTTYKGTPLGQSFIDAGSNAYYFPDSSIPNCPTNTAAPGFFCPAATLNLSATIAASDQSASAPINFSVANANSLFSTTATVAAAATLGGSSLGVSTANGSTFTGANTFDWGLPFYFGRKVFTAIESKNTGSGGLGPYFAF